jgi:hypothetical protein
VLAVGGAGSAIWAFLMWKMLHYSAPASIFYALCATSGAVLLFAVLVFPLRQDHRAEFDAMAVHFCLQLVGGLFLTLYAARYLLPALFPALLAFSLLIESAATGISKKAAWYTVLVTSAVLAAALSVSDYQLAAANKRIASELKTHVPGRTVHYAGRLGYLYYMDKEGFSGLNCGGAAVSPGDIIVRNAASGDDMRFVSGYLQQSAKLSRIEYPVFALRTMGRRAGFYGNDRLPYDLWKKPVFFEVFEAH